MPIKAIYTEPEMTQPYYLTLQAALDLLRHECSIDYQQASAVFKNVETRLRTVGNERVESITRDQYDRIKEALNAKAVVRALLPNGGAITWKESVPTRDDLPSTAEHGEARMVTDEVVPYAWDALDQEWIPLLGAGRPL